MIERDIIIKEESEWGHPGNFFFDFLEDIERENLPRQICFLGCGDGRYVIPASSNGFNCVAIDTDSLALSKLTARIKSCGAQAESVIILNQDFLKYEAPDNYPAVFITAALHYPLNHDYTLGESVQRINGYVRPGGLLLHEYIHFSERNNDPKSYFTSDQLAYFYKSGWVITENKVEVFEDGPNPMINIPHILHWGTFYAQKL